MRRGQKGSVGTRGSRRKSWTVSEVSSTFQDHLCTAQLTTIIMVLSGLANIRRRAIALKEQRRRLRMQQEGGGGVAAEEVLGDKEEESQSEEV